MIEEKIKLICIEKDGVKKDIEFIIINFAGKNFKSSPGF
jgi:hypothetical protein